MFPAIMKLRLLIKKDTIGGIIYGSKIKPATDFKPSVDHCCSTCEFGMQLKGLILGWHGHKNGTKPIFFFFNTFNFKSQSITNTTWWERMDDND